MGFITILKANVCNIIGISGRSRQFFSMNFYDFCFQKIIVGILFSVYTHKYLRSYFLSWKLNFGRKKIRTKI